MSYVGIWKSVDGMGEPVTLTFRKDGTFSRSRQFGTLTFVTSGRYKVDNRNFSFDQALEGFVGREPSPIEGVIKMPYRMRGAMLVFFPETSREQKFVLVQ
jgi:hypothetical protein